MTRREMIAGAALVLKKGSLDELDKLLRGKVDSGEVSGAAVLVRQDKESFVRGYGRTSANTPFLIASITKPMTVSGVMLLRDRGGLSIDDPVSKHIPEFTGGERNKVLIRHLLTHTSGLPDMLPENEALRQRHALLSAFVEASCKTPLLFLPGTKVKYQSMGILLASEIVQRVTRTPFPTFLKEEIFTKIGMPSTSLGLGGRRLDETAQVQVPVKNDWDWNSPYWRNLAAPWGGAISTVRDIADFLETFSPTVKRQLPRPWKPGTTAEMLKLQTPGLEERWGLGWSLRGSKFGRGCSESTYGHSGSTGTLAWHDPAARLTFVLLTTKPADQSEKTVLHPASDIASEAK